MPRPHKQTCGRQLTEDDLERLSPKVPLPQNLRDKIDKGDEATRLWLWLFSKPSLGYQRSLALCNQVSLLQNLGPGDIIYVVGSIAAIDKLAFTLLTLRYFAPPSHSSCEVLICLT